MATFDLTIEDRKASSSEQHRIVNDFSIQVATVNGSGSQSANTVLLRSIFQMGVPVSGKNLFPSNIAGLPTWYTIRASKQGYIARKKEIDFLVAMNAETGREDVMAIRPGSVCVYDEPLKLSALRDDLIFYPVPFDKLVVPVCPDAKLRRLVKNMIYVGVVDYLLDIDPAESEKALVKHFAKKKKAAELNTAAIRAGYDYARATFEQQCPFSIERMNENQGKLIIDGNAAAAIGCMFAGVTVVTWYPITPSSSLVEQLIDYLKKYRIGPDGKATFAVVQAEDELAAVGMVIGAGWVGARSMTSTSGPGISLMSEFAGLGYYAEVPAVIFDIQRVGPSTGLPTRTMQGDILKCAFLSHGDTRHILLFPASVEECFSFAVEAFELAEKFQTPVFVMSDLDLGMNNWMANPFTYPDKPMNRGKVLNEEELQRLGSFMRYKDIDGDGIPYRTLPGTNHPQAGYFTRGSGHNEKAQYSERPDDYVHNVDRLTRKLDTARSFVPAPVLEGAGTRVGVIAYGSSHWAMLETRDQLSREAQLDVDYLRLRGYPFSKQVQEFVEAHDRIYIVEQNRDGQMLALLKLDLPAEQITKLRSVRHYNGLPIDARSVTDAIISQESKGVS
ncbi:MAG TPA: 2-oxoacid:acceptor oxidoreductase subunit alpha [Candidatus Angelobacter sp.]|jgi:2-oxoglutarate ferredoxin oxidoreductase subunit alpha|nr:2-oxoacid:acceptor oxidoreductase subunit alpha [Candidatus Angelobacter sp.]